MNKLSPHKLESDQFPLDPVFENIEDWPIYKLSENRVKFINELTEYCVRKFRSKNADVVTDIIASTVYLERIRIKEEPWKVDPPDDMTFWKKIKSKLVEGSLDIDNEKAQQNNERILHEIVSRYSEEIVGTFKIKTFLFARKFLTVFFGRLLNTAKGRNMKRLWGRKHQLQKSLKVTGHLETVRSLFKHGSVVVVPTHFSNLDSILIGFAMDAIMGLPSFSYGAGLNLYNTGYTAYFMNRLGAYRVDRRKKNPIYLETLKSMSKLAIESGTNSLFFPGGTRSRSGELETKAKLGLLGTVVEAQRSLSQNESNKKVFVVPLILSYHFVLEAHFLIEQQLRRIGKEHFIKRSDESYSRRKILKFIWELFSKSSEIILSFGQPMDVLGNFVDADGNSFDKYNNPINVKEYFMMDGKVNIDLQREREYTKLLGKGIMDRFLKDNVVLTSHLLAFAVFNILKQQNITLDLFGLLRLPTEDFIFPIGQIKATITAMRDKLLKMEAEGDIKLSPEIHFGINELIQNGMSNLGAYHAKKPLRYNQFRNVYSEDFSLLYYYHNRLIHYDLASVVNWKAIKAEQAE